MLRAVARCTVPTGFIGDPPPGPATPVIALIGFISRRKGQDLGVRAFAALRRKYPDAVRKHKLRREIIATSLINEMVNRNGITFACGNPIPPDEAFVATPKRDPVFEGN